MMGKRTKNTVMMLLAGVLAGSITGPLSAAETSAAQSGSSPVHASVATPSDHGNTAMVASAEAWRMREGTFYKRNWGVDIVGVHMVSSGHMLEFRYRVLDATKATGVNEKRAVAFLIDEKSGKRLTVPVMDKVGQLRQTAAPQDGKTYWMVFANEGKVVHKGDKVDVAIGKFHATGLVVE